ERRQQPRTPPYGSVGHGRGRLGEGSPDLHRARAPSRPAGDHPVIQHRGAWPKQRSFSEDRPKIDRRSTALRSSSDREVEGGRAKADAPKRAPKIARQCVLVPSPGARVSREDFEIRHLEPWVRNRRSGSQPMSPADRTADAVRANASAVANAERMRSTVDDPRTTPLADPCALAILLDGDERRSSEATIDATTTAGPPTERHRSVHPT